MEKITIKNISSATVVISVPELRFRRELIPGRSINVSKEEWEELSFDTGIVGLINDHYLEVNDGEAEASSTTEVYSTNKLAEMLDKQDITGFAKFIPTAAEAQRDTVAKLAIEKGITNPAFTKLIKKYCNVDVIAAINRNHQLED